MAFLNHSFKCKYFEIFIIKFQCASHCSIIEYNYFGKIFFEIPRFYHKFDARSGKINFVTVFFKFDECAIVYCYTWHFQIHHPHDPTSNLDSSSLTIAEYSSTVILYLSNIACVGIFPRKTWFPHPYSSALSESISLEFPKSSLSEYTPLIVNVARLHGRLSYGIIISSISHHLQRVLPAKHVIHTFILVDLFFNNLSHYLGVNCCRCHLCCIRVLFHDNILEVTCIYRFAREKK